MTLDTVSVRELRNNGGDVLDRVQRGESLVVTRDGTPIADLSPVARPRLSTAEIVARARRLPPMDPLALRRDIDSLVDQSL
jgi:prevent-host-death family protein